MSRPSTEYMALGMCRRAARTLPLEHDFLRTPFTIEVWGKVVASPTLALNSSLGDATTGDSCGIARMIGRYVDRARMPYVFSVGL